MELGIFLYCLYQVAHMQLKRISKKKVGENNFTLSNFANASELALRLFNLANKS